MGRQARERARSGAALREMLQTKEGTRDVLEPTSPYEAMTRRMVDDVVIELRALRARVDSLFSVVVGAIVLDLLLRLAGFR